jgi:DNA-binding transcriptional ArsR family regulator
MASPVRREILAFLARNGESSAGSIADHVDHVARTSISTHLRLLRTCGLVIERRDGRRRLYHIDREGPANAALSYFQGLMADSLRQIPTTAASAHGSTETAYKSAG